jgi:hypothetical protein
MKSYKLPVARSTLREGPNANPAGTVAEMPSSGAPRLPAPPKRPLFYYISVT